MRRRENGQVLPLVALLLVAVGGAAVLTVRLGGLATDRGRASAAADAAALAGAAEGHDGAARLARANDGRLLSYRRDGDDTEVRVGVGRATATARATGGAALAPGGQSAALQAVLARVAQLLGRPVLVVRVHSDGLGIDVASGDADAVGRVAESGGLCRPHPDVQPTRFRVCGPPPAPGGETAER